MKKLSFGGRDRKIYTQQNDDLKGEEFHIKKTRCVITGRYYAPTCSRSHYDEYDYEPGGLTNRKSHRILILSKENKLTHMHFAIEDCHVTKIN